MKSYRKIEWTKLDNASKIFPSVANINDAKVFRVSCELYENIDPIFLQKSLDLTMESFPFYNSVLRRGAFWYYFENSNIQPRVEIESKSICAPIYLKNKRNLLFRVSHFNNRINLEVFHALSDGAGALWFIETLIFHYIILKYGNLLEGHIPNLDYRASMSQKASDSFKKNYHKNIGNRIKKRTEKIKAYQIKGTRLDEKRMKVIEGSMSVKDILYISHEYETTLTVFLTSLFLYSIYKDMPVSKRNLPVVLSVPINLRKYYDSATARNFFSTMNISYNFEKDSSDIKDIIRAVDSTFKENLTKEEIDFKLFKFMSLESNSLARVVPLPIKDISLKLADKINDRGITTSISNIGRINVPPEIKKYIKQFSVSVSAKMPKITLCSFEDRMVITFTSPFKETDIQRTFFQFLSDKGLEIEISSND